MKPERRFFNVELRAEGDESPKIVGYAAKYDAPSSDLGGFTEVIRKGAFSRAVKEDDVRALFNHDANFILGRTKSGTLSLADDDTGLRIEVDPPDTQWSRDLMESIKRGDVDQMSFAFAAVKDRWTEETNGDTYTVLRELLEVKLYDVSPVTYPAYQDTEVSVRDLIAGRDLTDEERLALRSILGTPAAAPPSLDLYHRRLDLLARA